MFFLISCLELPLTALMIMRMQPITAIAHAPILLAFATLAMASGASAFLCGGHSSAGGIASQSIRSRATFGARCAASAMQHVHVHGVPAIAKDLHPQSARSSSIGTERPNRRVGSALFTRRRRGFNKGSSSANDDDDEYDDEYIDNLINEKFDDVDFDDDLDDEGFIIDAEVEDRSTADDEDDREYEYARVGRRRGRGAERDEEGRSAGAVSSSSSSRREQRRSRRGSYGDGVDEYDGYDAEFDEEDYDYEEDYEEDYDSDDEDEDEDFEEGILIPNPILDSVDPEGASERIGELFEDPKFWKDMAVVALVVWTVYYLTYDPTDLIPWDSVTPNDFNLEGLYQKR